MQTLTYFRPWLAVLLLGFAVSAHGQVPVFSGGYSSQQVVTEGRNVLLASEGIFIHSQWQLWDTGSKSWGNFSDSNTYHGTATPTLEIVGATPAMDGLFYRFTNADPGGPPPGTPIRLTVIPQLLSMPSGISLDGAVGPSAGGLYISDAASHTIKHISSAEIIGQGNITDLQGRRVICEISLVAGKNGQAGAADGDAGEALFNQPTGMAPSFSAADGTSVSLVVTDTANGTLRRITLANGKVTTLAGSSTLRGNQDGAGAAARFSNPLGVARAADGTYYVADSANHTIRKVTTDGTVSTFAGSPGNAGTADGVGSVARFNNPTGIAVDASGTVYVADTTNNLIRKITPAGEVTTLAGLAGVAGAQDGTGNQALFNGPTGLASAVFGVFVADTGNSTIRLVSEKGAVSTFAGVAGVGGLLDTATGINYRKVLFNQPRALIWDGMATILFVADTGNAAIRAISYYDATVVTLPLADNGGYYTVSTPVAPTPVAPVAPTPAPTLNGSSSLGGGGATSGWFLLALTGAGLLRKWQRRST